MKNHTIILILDKNRSICNYDINIMIITNGKYEGVVR